MSNLLTWNHATVTVCHSKTKDLPSVVSLFSNMGFLICSLVYILPYKTAIFNFPTLFFSFQVREGEIVVVAIGSPRFVKVRVKFNTNLIIWCLVLSDYALCHLW